MSTDREPVIAALAYWLLVAWGAVLCVGLIAYMLLYLAEFGLAQR